MSSHDSTSPFTYSVIITSYTVERYDYLSTCIESVVNQTYVPDEIILIVETDAVESRLESEFGQHPLVCIERTGASNLAEARNRGAECASGDVVVFIDDDCIASPNWLQRIDEGYQSPESPLAVGGKAIAKWPSESPPSRLPSEFYWLVGVTHEGFRESRGFTRNTFGCNISFDRDTFMKLGGFDPSFGKDHGHNLQGEETELSLRLAAEHETSVYYVPHATVEHEVFSTQLSRRWLVNRAFWQGYTKGVLSATHTQDAIGPESEFLHYILSHSLPKYSRQFLNQPQTVLIIIVWIVLLTVSTGIGYVLSVLQN